MKLLSVFDYIYYCVYKIIMKSPSKDVPHRAVVVFMVMIIGIHAVFLYNVIADLACIVIAHSSEKIIIIVGTFVIIAMMAYYYDFKKNGERIVKHYSGKIGERRSVAIGYIIFIETFSLPFIVFGILYFCQHYLGWTTVRC